MTEDRRPETVPESTAGEPLLRALRFAQGAPSGARTHEGSAWVDVVNGAKDFQVADGPQPLEQQAVVERGHMLLRLWVLLVAGEQPDCRAAGALGPHPSDGLLGHIDGPAADSQAPLIFPQEGIDVLDRLVDGLLVVDVILARVRGYDNRCCTGDVICNKVRHEPHGRVQVGEVLRAQGVQADQEDCVHPVLGDLLVLHPCVQGLRDVRQDPVL